MFLTLSGGGRKCHSQMPIEKKKASSHPGLRNVLESARASQKVSIYASVIKFRVHFLCNSLFPAHDGDSSEQDRGCKSSETLAKAALVHVSSPARQPCTSLSTRHA